MSASNPVDLPHDPSLGRAKRRRQRRKPGAARPDPKPPATRLVPEKLVAQLGATPAEPAKESPLTADEIATMRRGLRFLREHRKLLKLKLNAQEDLLVNGVREPDHRGVCTHLFAKVEYARVHAVVEQLRPEQRPSFMEGVLQFSSDLSHVLLYLEALRDSGSRSAGVAVQEALKRIDFRSISEGQLRRVLDLVVLVFSPENRTRILLQLFSVSGFSETLQGALAKFPAALSEAITPLWEAYHAYLRPGPSPNQTESPQLLAGMREILTLDTAALLALHPKARERLTRAVLALSVEASKGLNTTAVTALIEHTPRELQAKFEETRLLGWLALGQDGDVVRRLSELRARAALPARLERLNKATNQPRIGSIAVGERIKHTPTARHLGTCLRTLMPLHVWPAEPDGRALLADALHDFGRARIPSVAAIHSAFLPETGPCCIAVACRGRGLARRMSERPALSTRVAWAIDAASLLGTLSALGIGLADAHPLRFEVDNADRLWLVDLCKSRGGIDRALAPPVAGTDLAPTLELVLWLLRNNSNQQLPAAWIAELSQTTTHQAIVSILNGFAVELSTD
jgi:hypothetical protein